jgi:hypothetical protein
MTSGKALFSYSYTNRAKDRDIIPVSKSFSNWAFTCIISIAIT